MQSFLYLLSTGMSPAARVRADLAGQQPSFRSIAAISARGAGVWGTPPPTPPACSVAIETFPAVARSGLPFKVLFFFICLRFLSCFHF